MQKVKIRKKIAQKTKIARIKLIKAWIYGSREIFAKKVLFQKKEFSKKSKQIWRNQLSKNKNW